MMKMSDSHSQQKKDLMSASEQYKDDIRESLKAMGESLGETGKNAIMITGALVGGYLLYRLIRPSDSPSKKKTKILQIPAGEISSSASIESRQASEEQGFIDKLGQKVMEEAALFLLALAKEKLLDYLNKEEENDS